MSNAENLIGRDYEIDYMDAASDLMYAEEILNQNLIDQGKVVEQSVNIDGFLGFCVDRWKGSHPISFKDIPKLLETEKPSYRGSFRTGILFLYESPTKFDFLRNSTGEVLIARGTNVGELEIPRVIFSNPKEVVTPHMIDRSFDVLAQHILKRDQKMQFLIGLTHPRLGSLINKRWAFGLEEHPFPEEVYKLIDLSLMNAKIEDTENLQAVRQLVLVYQPIEEFFKRRQILPEK